MPHCSKPAATKSAIPFQRLTGPYVDEDGNTAISTTTIGSNWLGKTGIRLMASVEWSGNDNTNIEVAQGHNSAFVDEDGTAYVVYHTRFSNRGEEHEVRVRELLTTSDGWLTAAPYEYVGAKADTKGYEESKLTGEYDSLNMTRPPSSKDCKMPQRKTAPITRA